MWRLKIAEGGKDPYLSSTNNFVGRQTWEFDPNYGSEEERLEVEKARLHYWNHRHQVKPSSDVLWRMQFMREKKFKQDIAQVKIEDGEEVSYEKVTTILRRSMHLFAALQAEDGHWPAENAGLMYFMPPLVFFLYITGHLNSVFPEEHRKEILRYLYCHQNKDGGWGFHLEGHSTMFGTTLSYICMRLLGEGPDGGLDGACGKDREWILDHGSATVIPSWGKTWLSVLGVREWIGCNPIPPEFWLLPSFLPVHPAKMWCYCRLVYMPMSYLYGRRFVGPITSLVLQLREELYAQPYNEINWKSTRHLCAKEDIYYPPPLLQDIMWDSLYIFTEPFLTRWPFSKIREQALKTTMKHIHYEDENSRYITIGAVEKVLLAKKNHIILLNSNHMLACWAEDPNGDAFKKHLARIPDYIWIAEDGMKMQSFGSQEWDASLAIQALLATDISHEIGPTLKNGHDFIKASQVKDNPFGDFKSMYRHISRGSWTFSDQDHGWQVSDCTSEGLKPLPPDAVQLHFPGLHFPNIPPNHRITLWYSEDQHWEVGFGIRNMLLSFTHGWSDVVQGIPLFQNYWVTFTRISAERYDMVVYSPDGCDIRDFIQNEHGEVVDVDAIDFADVEAGVDAEHGEVVAGVEAGVDVEDANSENEEDEEIPEEILFDRVIIARARFRLPQDFVPIALLEHHTVLMFRFEDVYSEGLVINQEMSRGRQRFWVSGWTNFVRCSGIQIGQQMRLRYRHRAVTWEILLSNV
ncbi:hypothetical protein SSX86_004350 [Deinandra increscens subsp. villosa]|uniref:Terpene cyclase/mutase family member n=2 Tax=Deinandra increscens subsp. villosa TaxID=3103831 RepID=A0AAP0HAU5_9ASTR